MEYRGHVGERWGTVATRLPCVWGPISCRGTGVSSREQARPPSVCRNSQVFMFVCPQDAVTELLARTTAQLQAVERELAEERRKLQCSGEQAEAVSERLVSIGPAHWPPSPFCPQEPYLWGPKLVGAYACGPFWGIPRHPRIPELALRPL